MSKKNSLYRRLFDKPIVCPVCGCTFKWAINPVSGTIYCYNNSINDPDSFCNFQYSKTDIFTPEQIVIFNRLVAVCRLFTVG